MIDYKNPRLIVETAKLQPGETTWRSPSNIALIKYWGKHGNQLPRNPSLSFTLDKAFTETTLAFRPKKMGIGDGISLKFFFEGKENEAFAKKILEFLNSITDIFPFLRQLHFTIHSSNSFPHSAGIASSASSMSALALCLCSLEDKVFGTLKDDSAFRQKASYIARLGSGSACRSIYAKAALWGVTRDIPESSDLYAIDYSQNIHPVFQNFHNDILIISKKVKSISSRAGHELMDNNIYADNRYTQARQRLQEILIGLKKGEIKLVGKIIEQEALTLHALMMSSSNPNFLLLKPNTIAAIERIWQFRADTGLPLYFSLDAGPNLHLLYPDEIKEKVKTLIVEELIQFCQDGQWIADSIGLGPLELSEATQNKN